MKTIVTHPVNFHPDDVFGTAALLLLLKKTAPKEKIKVLRSTDPKIWAKGDFVLDIGRQYAPAKDLFDHHQEGGAGARSNGGIPYASFGLIWKKYGKKIAGSASLAEYVDEKLVSVIDADDNGVSLYSPTREDVQPILLESYVYMKVHEARAIVAKTKNKKDFDRVFMKLLPWAEDIILGFIQKGIRREAAKKLALKVYSKAKDKKIIIMDEYIGFDFSEFPEPLVTVYPDLRTPGNWAAKSVQSGTVDKSDLRFRFPESWRGKNTPEELARACGVADATFCHNSGFLAVAGSKEGVLEMVRKGISML